MQGFLGPILALAVLLGSSGCALPQFLPYRAAGFSSPAQGARVLRMPTDIEVSELNAGGMLEARADWTDAARRNVDAWLDTLLSAGGETMILYEEPDDLDKLRRHTQVIKLHLAVRNAILTHKVDQLGSESPTDPLPTVKDRFDYSLGPDPGSLAGDFDADYALFVFLRQTFLSVGRILVSATASALGGGVPSGPNGGSATLVDLRSGEVVWFNRVWYVGGDLREHNGAHDALGWLLEDFPL